MGTHRLGLDDRSLDALFHDDGRHQVAQQCAPMTGISSKFPTCYTMTHCFALFLRRLLASSLISPVRDLTSLIPGLRRKRLRRLHPIVLRTLGTPTRTLFAL